MSENIFLFIPNLIGYVRILLLAVACCFMYTNYILAATLYFSSVILDEADGMAARHFNQGTNFGALLDMVTDRCATMCLMLFLSHFYPEYTLWFQLSATIDVSSHWFHVHASMASGYSHKCSKANENPILNLYYTSRIVLSVMCYGNEIFYLALYLLHFTEGPSIITKIGMLRILCCICFPIAVIKLLLAVMQGYYAVLTLGQIDLKERQALKNN